MEPIGLSSLPLDIQKKFALTLDYKNIINLCKTSKRFRLICNDPYFWRDKLKRDYPLVSKYFLDQYKMVYEFYYWVKKYKELREINDITYWDTEEPEMIRQQQIVLKIKSIIDKLPKNEVTIPLTVKDDFFWDEDAQIIYTAELSALLGFLLSKGNIIVLHNPQQDPIAIYIYEEDGELRHIIFDYRGCIEDFPEILELAKYNTKEFIQIYGQEYWGECPEDE